MIDHIAFSLRCASKASASLVMLEYTLAPTDHYPTQLIQAAEGLKHILKLTPPSKITIAGDSAGGHLSLSLLAHLMHPSPDAPEVNLSSPLAGICLICPFLSFDYDKRQLCPQCTKKLPYFRRYQVFQCKFQAPRSIGRGCLKRSLIITTRCTNWVVERLSHRQNHFTHGRMGDIS